MKKLIDKSGRFLRWFVFNRKKMFQRTRQIIKSGRFLRWFVFNRKKMFQRTRQIIFVARFISRYTKTNADDIALAKLDKILKEFISEYLGGMEKQEAIELAKKITGVKRGPLKAINVSLDTNKSKLGFTIKI